MTRDLDLFTPIGPPPGWDPGAATERMWARARGERRSYAELFAAIHSNDPAEIERVATAELEAWDHRIAAIGAVVVDPVTDRDVDDEELRRLDELGPDPVRSGQPVERFCLWCGADSTPRYLYCSDDCVAASVAEHRRTHPSKNRPPA
jgi:hypothetical protein